MSDALLDKVFDRLEAVLSQTGATTAQGNAVLADVETALVLARREGFARGGVWQADRAEVLRSYSTVASEEMYPLPTRTRQVLREEPDPHGYAVVYAYSTAQREIMVKHEPQGAWFRVTELSDGHTNMLRPTAERIDLWASLKANPDRTEQVPADESDPWGEGAAPALLPYDSDECCTVPGCTHHTVSGRDRAESGWYYLSGVGWRCPAHR